jgi:hypothetical protein
VENNHWKCLRRGWRRSEVAEAVEFFQTAALAQEKSRLWLDGREQVHDRGGIGRAHAEIDDRDPVGRGVGHRLIFTADAGIVHLREHVHIIAKVDQQDEFTKFFQRHAGIARQPVFYNFILGFHPTSARAAVTPRLGFPFPDLVKTKTVVLSIGMEC